MRSRLSIPSWLRAWPPGLVPRALHVASGRFELLYRLPNGSWCRALVRGRRLDVEVQASEGFPELPRRKLEAALHQRLARTPGACPWFDAVQATLSEQPAVWRELPEGEDAAGGEFAQQLACFNFARALERGDIDAALSVWEQHGDGLRGDPRLDAKLCVVVMRALEGDRPGAAELAEELSALADDFEDEDMLGALFSFLARPERACVHLEQLAQGRHDDARRLLRAAIEAGEVDTCARAAKAMLERASTLEQRVEAIELMIEGGAFSLATRTLEAALAEAPEVRAFVELAAQLELWRAGLAPYHWAAFTFHGEWL